MCTLGSTWRTLQPFSVIFQTASKFVVVFIRLILGKVGLEEFTGPQRKIDVICEFDFKVVLKDLLCK